MGVTDPRNSMQVCVRYCPPRDMNEKHQVRDFAIHNNSRLCRYDVDPKNYVSKTFGENGPCPDLPIYQRQVFYIAACCKWC